jgi:hypothetical protein
MYCEHTCAQNDRAHSGCRGRALGRAVHRGLPLKALCRILQRDESVCPVCEPHGSSRAPVRRVRCGF